jgi:hypothetical protein
MPSYAYPFRAVAKQKLPPKEREERRNNWLATTGSLQERRMYEKLAKQQGLDEKDRALVFAWLAKPDGFEKRNALFWHAAKRQILGPVVYDMAMERHKKLRPDEWLVACLITEGLNQKEEIAPMMGKSPRAVEYLVAEVKQEIVQDLGCNIEAITITQIARWFLGL